MYTKIKKNLAIFLCAAICMTTNIDLYAVENDAIASIEQESAETESTAIESSVIESSATESTIIESTETEATVTESTEIKPTEPAQTETEETESPRTESEETETEVEIEAETEAEMEDEASETDTQEEIEIDSETETAIIKTEAELEAEFLRLQDELNQRLEAKGFTTSGYIDSGMDAETLGQGEMLPFSLSERTVPTKYSSVENGQITSIKNQGGWGACWTFGPVAAAESQYKKITGVEADMSESHLIHFFYNDDIKGPDGGLEGDAIVPLATNKVNNGGNSMFTTFALARWTGIADEGVHESLVYPSEVDTKNTTALDIPQEYAYTDLVHMQNAYWINKGDAGAVKQAIMDYGAAVITYKHNEIYSSDSVDKGLYNGPTVYYNLYNEGTNHVVSIVGWDDDFDRENFIYTARNQAYQEYGLEVLPKNNGAWLIKNSWGSGYGDEGYFWMSYEDVSLSNTMVAFVFERADNYDHIYQHDGSAGVKYQSAETITTAAVYTGTGYQMIQAVGVGIASVATDYTVEIYTDLTSAENPQSGVLRSQTTGTTTFQGYHTIELEKWVPVTEGETFSVVITLSNGKIEDKAGAAIFVDQSYDNGKSVRFVAKTNPGETFIKIGENWQDAASEAVGTKTTYRIKAYTTDGTLDLPQENIQLSPEMVKEIDEQEYCGTPSEPIIEINYMGESLVKDTDFRVTYINNTGAADKDSEVAPKAIITGVGKYTGSIEQTFTIIPKDITEDMVENVTLVYTGAAQEDIVLKNGEIRLSKGTDYNITFNKQPCNAGSYTASITGINNYTGEIAIKVTIAKATITDDMVVLATDKLEYTGVALKPAVKVIAHDGTEIPAKNYSISYKNNTNVGTNTSLTVTGKGYCQGKVTKTFEITPKSIESDCTATIAKAVYSGKALTPTVTVKWNNKILKKNKDYTIVYENNTQAADMSSEKAPKVIITGIGNYAGKIEPSFTIQPKEIAESNVSVQIAYDEKGSRLRVLAGSTEFEEGRDYTLSAIYKAGTDIAVNMAELALGEKYNVEVVLIGNYKVKNKTTALKKNIVSKRDINSLNIKFADEGVIYTYAAKALKPKLLIQDTDGKNIASSNYTISYVNNTNAGTAQAVVTGKGAYAGTVKLSFVIGKKKLDSSAIQLIKDQTYTQKEIRPTVKVLDGKKVLKAGAGKDYTYIYGNNINVSYDENGNVTAGAYVRISLSDNYEIDDEAAVRYYKIIPASISSITLSDAYYKGQAVLPNKTTVKAGKLQVPEECYETTADNNIDISSKALLTVTAKPCTNYTGSKTKKYRIVKQELKKLVLPVIPDQPYLKQPVTVEGYYIKDSEGNDIGTDQYDIIFSNNKKVGKATITYKAKSTSLYKGNAAVKFNITKATMAQAIDYNAAQTIEKQYTGSEITLTEMELRQLAPIKDAVDGYQLPYTVTYSKNIRAGKAVVRLTGKDYLQGSINLYFTITPKSISTVEIISGPKQLSSKDGFPVYLELKEVNDDGIVLKRGKDYTCSYINADKKGIACLTITGVGSYIGTRYIYYNIT